MMEKPSMPEDGPRMPQAGPESRSKVMGQETALDAARGHLAALLKEMCDTPGWKVGTPWWTDRLQAARLTRREIDRLEFLAATRVLRGATRR